MPSRMITSEISISDKLASLTSKSLSLFFFLIPHFNAHGKMNGQPDFIKGQVVPKIEWLTTPEITKCLKEINEKTNVKWFKNRGLYWIHSLNFKEHQPGLRRLGKDELPDYSVDTPGLLPPEVDVNVDVNVNSNIEVVVNVNGNGVVEGIPPSPKGEFEVLNYLNLKSGRKFELIDSNLDFIKARLKESGRTVDLLKKLIDFKIMKWKGTEQEEYLRPATLFNKTKCAQYIGEMCKVKIESPVRRVQEKEGMRDEDQFKVPVADVKQMLSVVKNIK